ncbi:MAG TPA: hypothetical protein VHH88_04760 [Verrucomicrobiae bacterium]|nr:hypothetical protein [Verrucomicrobiae bacterium]
MQRDVTQIARQYASRNALLVRESLGGGIHGLVYLLQSSVKPGGTAMKVFHAREFFQRELRVYERLQAVGVRQILGFAVPQFVGADNELWAVEMTVVERPFVLDFAGAYLDNDAPWFEDEKWEIWEADKREKFGERWREVKAVLAALEDYGIHMLDVNPGNVTFAD